MVGTAYQWTVAGAAGRVRPAGAGHRSHARGGPVCGHVHDRGGVGGDVPVRSAGGSGPAGDGARPPAGGPDRQEACVRGCHGPVRARHGVPAVTAGRARAVAVSQRRPGRSGLCRDAVVPAGHAAGCDRRRQASPRRPGRCDLRGVDGGGDRRSGPGPHGRPGGAGADGVHLQHGRAATGTAGECSGGRRAHLQRSACDPGGCVTTAAAALSPRGKGCGYVIDTGAIEARLDALRAADPPTHGGRVLSYVYDHGRPELDELVARAVQRFLPVNGLDPTTFTSVATLERELVHTCRSILHGEEDVVGSITSGGTESCMLAVKAARDTWCRTYPGRGTP